MELHNEAIQRRITEINRYISDLIKVKKNIEKTEVKIELHSAFEETIAIDFTNPFFCADLKHRFVEQFIEKAIDYYLKEYQHLTSINK